MSAPKDKALAITEGPWTVKLHPGYPGYAYVPECMGNECSLITAEDATLVADAGSTYNSCQILPSEMLEKLREAEKTIADLEATCHQMAHTITTFDNPDPA